MRFDEFNIRHLRAAAAVARLGTVSSAADEINISQPAVTQALVRLENQLDEKLFKRNNEGTQTTPSGSILVQHIEAAFNHISRGFDALSRSKNAAASMPPQNLVTMPQIRALIALADNGSYIGASTATGLAQPTLHRAVQELSEITNAKITLKRGRNVSLSSKGRTLAQAFRRVRRELDQALDEIASSEGRIVGQIRVGSLPISRSKVLPAAFVALHQKYPDLGLDIVEGPYSELLERLRDGDIDILLGALRDPVPGHDVEQHELFKDLLLICGAKDHPLAGKGEVSTEQLSRFPWVVAREGSPIRANWERLFEAYRSDMSEPIKCMALASTRAILLKGPYLTLLSPHQIENDVKVGGLAAIGKPLSGSERTIGFTVMKDWNMRAVHHELIEEIKRAI